MVTNGIPTSTLRKLKSVTIECKEIESTHSYTCAQFYIPLCTDCTQEKPQLKLSLSLNVQTTLFYRAQSRNTVSDITLVPRASLYLNGRNHKWKISSTGREEAVVGQT